MTWSVLSFLPICKESLKILNLNAPWVFQEPEIMLWRSWNPLWLHGLCDSAAGKFDIFPIYPYDSMLFFLLQTWLLCWKWAPILFPVSSPCWDCLQLSLTHTGKLIYYRREARELKMRFYGTLSIRQGKKGWKAVVKVPHACDRWFDNVGYGGEIPWVYIGLNTRD